MPGRDLRALHELARFILSVIFLNSWDFLSSFRNNLEI